MTTLIIWLIFWALCGVNSFIYWWTKHHDLTVRDLLTSGVFAAIVGPLAFLVGWQIHGEKLSSKVLLRRRVKKP